MTLFSEMHRTDIGPPTYGEPHYSYLDQSARPEAARVRAVLEASFAQYPREERTAFLSAFRSSNDAQFLAAAFELYLHEVLRRLGYKVKVHPKNPTGKSSRPDFLVIHPDNSPVYIEAVLATDVPDNQRAVQARKNTVYDVLNGLGPIDFYLGMEMESAPETPPPARKLKNELQRWLSQLDADSISRAIEANGRSSFPRHNFEHDGWRIEFFAVPKSREKRGQPDIRPIGFQSSEASCISTWQAIRDAVLKKGSKYGNLSAPLVVAVNVGRFDVDEIDIMQALFGQEKVVIRVGDRNAEPEMQRELNGVWTSPSGPRYRRVSGVLIAPDVHPWTIVTRSIRLYHNPWANYVITGPICSLPQAVPQDNEMKCVDGTHPRDVLSLPEGWPACEVDPGPS